MKIRALVIALGLLAAAGLPLAAQDAPAPASLALGTAAPLTDHKLKNVDGGQITLADMKGDKGLLVVFTCNACPYAQAWEQRIVALGNSCGPMGIGAIAVNSNDPTIVPGDAFEPMKERAAKLQMAFPYVVDEGGTLARAFGATRTPEAFLFDASGKLVYHGTIDDNHKEPDKVTKSYLKDALQAVGGGKPVGTAETKAMGCGIKFKKA